MSFQGMPVPTKKAENKANFGMNTELKLIEWEKNQIKPFFQALETDKTGKGGLPKEHLLELLEKLKEDECIIGKEPDMNQIEEGFFETLFEEQTKDGPCKWIHFRENVVNMFPWKMVDNEKLQEIVNNFFALS